MHRSSSVYKWKHSRTVLKKYVVDFDVRGQQGMDFFHYGKALLWIMDSHHCECDIHIVRFLLAVCNLIRHGVDSRDEDYS